MKLENDTNRKEQMLSTVVTMYLEERHRLMTRWFVNRMEYSIDHSKEDFLEFSVEMNWKTMNFDFSPRRRRRRREKGRKSNWTNAFRSTKSKMFVVFYIENRSTVNWNLFFIIKIFTSITKLGRKKVKGRKSSQKSFKRITFVSRIEENRVKNR